MAGRTSLKRMKDSRTCLMESEQRVDNYSAPCCRKTLDLLNIFKI